MEKKKKKKRKEKKRTKFRSTRTLPCPKKRVRRSWPLTVRPRIVSLDRGSGGRGRPVLTWSVLPGLLARTSCSRRSTRDASSSNGERAAAAAAAVAAPPPPLPPPPLAAAKSPLRDEAESNGSRWAVEVEDPWTEFRQLRLTGRPGCVSAGSPSEASESAEESWSAAYLQDRWDFWHWEQGRFLSHFNLRLRHSVQDLTGRGRLTLRAADGVEEDGGGGGGTVVALNDGGMDCCDGWDGCSWVPLGEVPAIGARVGGLVLGFGWETGASTGTDTEDVAIGVLM